MHFSRIEHDHRSRADAVLSAAKPRPANAILCDSDHELFVKMGRERKPLVLGPQEFQTA
jgi:hypothetical protein